MCECIIISCAMILLGYKLQHFHGCMAVICDMAKGGLADHRYFLESVHDCIKTDFMTNKMASSYIKIIFIMCFLLLTAPNNKKMSNAPYITNGVFSVCIATL